MFGIKLLTASAVILMSSSALANIQITDTNNGAWVVVTENGKMLSNALVSVTNVPQQRNTYITNDNGRVFIPLSLKNSRSVKYKVETAKGEYQYRYAFHSSNK